MTEFNLIKAPECPEFLEEAAAPISREVGRTLGNIFFAVFNPINYPIERLRIRQSENLKKYEQDINNELTKIPEENLVEPPLKIVGPALDASKYYIEEESSRKLFAKLIASSMNIDTVEIVRSTFIEIIKQMEPLDAKIFKTLSSIEHCGVGQIKFGNSKGKQTLYEALFPLDFLNTENMELVATSISNIIRLGLIGINDTSSYTDKSIYEPLKQHPVYEYFAKNYTDSVANDPRVISLKESTWSITPLGKHFATTCIPATRTIIIHV